jgi:uncharacterized protein (TIGR02186 family)
MRVTLLAILLVASLAAAAHAQAPRSEEVQADISTREVSIKTDFGGTEILIFGNVDFSHAPTVEEGGYDVIVVVSGPSEPVVVRRKQRVAGIWVNGPGKVFLWPPRFYAVLSSGPLQEIASDKTLKRLGIGLSNLDFGRYMGTPEERRYREAVVRLRKEEGLYQEHDDGVSFIGRSLFRATVDLPVNVPIGRYATDVYLFRDGALLNLKQGSLDVNKAGLERAIYTLAFQQPFLYGLLAVVLAVLAGLGGWFFFRRD